MRKKLKPKLNPVIQDGFGGHRVCQRCLVKWARHLIRKGDRVLCNTCFKKENK
jgi:hypothetical protein